jgi:hypothetical protein
MPSTPPASHEVGRGHTHSGAARTDAVQAAPISSRECPPTGADFLLCATEAMRFISNAHRRGCCDSRGLPFPWSRAVLYEAAQFEPLTDELRAQATRAGSSARAASPSTRSARSSASAQTAVAVTPSGGATSAPPSSPRLASTSTRAIRSSTSSRATPNRGGALHVGCPGCLVES